MDGMGFSNMTGNRQYRDHKFAVRLDPPMTPERVLFAIQEIKQQGDVGG